jgi:hypothetical protein
MEMIITFASLAGAVYWLKWFVSTWPGNLNKLARGYAPWLLMMVPVLCAGIIWFVVSALAASDVVSNSCGLVEGCRVSHSFFRDQR